MMSLSGEVEFGSVTHLEALNPPPGIALADFHAALCFVWCQLVLSTPEDELGMLSFPASQRLRVLLSNVRPVVINQRVRAAKRERKAELSAQAGKILSVANILYAQGYPDEAVSLAAATPPRGFGQPTNHHAREILDLATDCAVTIESTKKIRVPFPFVTKRAYVIFIAPAQFIAVYQISATSCYCFDPTLGERQCHPQLLATGFPKVRAVMFSIVLQSPQIPAAHASGEAESEAERDAAARRRVNQLSEEASTHPVDFSCARHFTTQSQKKVSIALGSSGLRASCGTALQIPVITFMGKKGELIYVISLPGRISVAARGTKGNLVEVGYATHEREADDDRVPVRRLAYISLQPAFQGKKLGNLIVLCVAELARTHRESIVRVGHPDPGADHFWIPAGFDIHAAKSFYYYFHRQRMDHISPPSSEDLKDTTVVSADGFTKDMLLRNKSLCERHWMLVHPDTPSSRRFNCIAHSLGVHSESVDFEPRPTKQEALLAARELYERAGYALVLDRPEELTDQTIQAIALGKNVGDLVVLYGTVRQYPNIKTSQMEDMFLILHAACLAEGGAWTSKLGTQGPLVTHACPSLLANDTNGQPIAVFCRVLPKRSKHSSVSSSGLAVDLAKELQNLWDAEDAIYRHAKKCIAAFSMEKLASSDLACAEMYSKLLEICAPLRRLLEQQCVTMKCILATGSLLEVFEQQCGERIHVEVRNTLGTLLRLVTYRHRRQVEGAPEGFPLELFFCGILRLLRYPAGRRVLALLAERLEDREVEIIGTIGADSALCVYEGEPDQQHHLFVPSAKSSQSEPLDETYRAQGRDKFAAASVKSGGRYASGAPNPNAKAIHHLELCIDSTLAVHSLFIGLVSEGWPFAPKITFYVSPYYVSIFHEACHLVRMLLGCTAGKVLPLPFQVSQSYDELEEYLNIFADPELSERCLLDEMKLPIRLGHHGVQLLAPVEHGYLAELLRLFCGRHSGGAKLRVSLLKAKLELGLISIKEYDALLRALERRK